jgi:hypothetical protein
MAIRRLQRLHQRELSTAQVVLSVAGCYGVFALKNYWACLALQPGKASYLMCRDPLPHLLPPNPYLQMSVILGTCLHLVL